MSKRDKHWDAIIIGTSALVLAVAFPQSYYEKYRNRIKPKVPKNQRNVL